MKKVLLMLVLVFAAQLGMAQDTKQEALKYLKASGMESAFTEMKNQINAMVPADKQADFSKEIDAAVNDFYNKQADVLVKYYDVKTIQSAIKKSEETKAPAQLDPLEGDKLVQLQKDSEAAGEDFGLTVQGLVMKYVPEEMLQGEE